VYPSTVQQPVRAGDKLDFLRYQSPVKKKAAPVGVVSPSIKDTLRRVGLCQKINREGLAYIFGTRDAEQRLGHNVQSSMDHDPFCILSMNTLIVGQEGLASGPSTIPPTIKVFIERIQNGSFATHAREDVNRFNKLMKKYNPTSYWIKQNLYAKYVDNAEKLQNYLEHVHEVIKKQRAQKQESSYIGRHIRKKFADGKWYSGIITSSDEEDLYHVKYDDGDSEDLDHDEMHECLLSHEENESIAKKKKETHV
jgi:hypothetical protein